MKSRSATSSKPRSRSKTSKKPSQPAKSPPPPTTVAGECDNPWKDEYIRQEIRRFYGEPPKLKPGREKIVYKKHGVEVGWAIACGHLDDYFSVNLRLGTDPNGLMSEHVVPFLRIDGKLWMSYAPAEIQSQWVPIQASYGWVAVGGLGLGYCALAMAARAAVTKVVVFENNERVIEAFTELCDRRPDLRLLHEKIRIVVGDVRKELPKYKPDDGMPWGLVYMDPYLDRLNIEVVRDLVKLWTNGTVNADSYRFWGQEEIILWLTQHNRRPPVIMLCRHDARFIHMYARTVQLRQHHNFDNALYAKVVADAFDKRGRGPFKIPKALLEAEE